MAQQAGGQRPEPRYAPDSPEERAYLEDYASLLAAVPFPSVVVDHRWDVVLANAAFASLFGQVGPYPGAMPCDNFLRFVLFHPDAATVLDDHESQWCLPLLGVFARTLERHPGDAQLQAIRRDIAQDPIMEAAYRYGLPHWIRTVGERACVLDGAVRTLHHPDPRRGETRCRIVDETPPALRERGRTRLTFVLQEPRRASGRPGRRTVSHLRVVPGAG
jgi:PAS domain-containing protein